MLSVMAIVDNRGTQWYKVTMSSLYGNVVWEQAGMPDPESGLLAFGGLPLLPYHGQHSAHLHWDFVHWRRPPLDPTWEPIPWVGMLDEFVRIRDANEVVSFVVKRGPLGLCQHALPATHNRSWPPSEDSESCYHMGAALYEHGLGGYEYVGAWLYFAELMRSALNVGATLQVGSEPDETDLWRLRDMPNELTNGGLGPPEPLSDREARSAELSLEITSAFLMRMASIVPLLSFKDGSPTMVFSTSTFGGLVLQLTQALSRSQGLTICASCGLPYSRFGRKVQAGRRNYCPSCGPRAALRDAQRAYALRKRGKQDGKT